MLFTMRLGEDVYTEWKRKAGEAGLSVSAWVRGRCNDRRVAELADAGSGERLRKEGVDRDPEGELMANSPSIAGSNPAPVTKKEKACIHGTPKGWRCWQCGGIAVIRG